MPEQTNTTQPDAMAKVEAIVEIAKAISAKIGQFDLDGPKHPSINEVAEAAYEATAAVIVPATAEQWARHFDDLAAINREHDAKLRLEGTFGDELTPSFASCYATAYTEAARRLRAGLSAGATGGDSDE